MAAYWPEIGPRVFQYHFSQFLEFSENCVGWPMEGPSLHLEIFLFMMVNSNWGWGLMRCVAKGGLRQGLDMSSEVNYYQYICSIDTRPCYGLLCFLISPNRMVLLKSIESGLVDYNCGEPTVCLPVSLLASL